MSRQMKREEIAAFEAKYGYKPTEIKVALDAVAFFVNKNNPIQALSLSQIDSIFSSTFKRGGSNISDWGDAGVPSMKGKAISIYGRNSASGTNGFVKEIRPEEGGLQKLREGTARLLPPSCRASAPTNRGSAIPASDTSPPA